VATTNKNQAAVALDEEQSLLAVAKVLLRGIGAHSPTFGPKSVGA
jgi:hypothetical protein